jgi:uncharacterized protein (TIGR00251 family)
MADLYRVLGDDAVELAVHASPGAGRAGVVGRHGEALKVKVAAPAEHGKANDALVTVLADAFGVSRSAVTLVAGGSSRAKRFRIDGVTPAAFSTRLAALVEPDAPATRKGRPPRRR